MSEQKHGTEPWEVFKPWPGAFGWNVRDANGRTIAECLPEHDARRMVDAVNAAAGLRTTALESGSLTRALEALRWLALGAADARETTQARLDGIEALKALGMAP